LILKLLLQQNSVRVKLFKRPPPCMEPQAECMLVLIGATLEGKTKA
jgi:hypothetical protein